MTFSLAKSQMNISLVCKIKEIKRIKDAKYYNNIK